MKRRGAEIVVRALEAEGVRFAFGIPGTHNIELYDALERSDKIEPVLVTDEQAASFMADGVSRSSDHVGLVNVVPGPGVSHTLSGVAEAYMDTVPLVVLVTGVRDDTGHAFQLHDVDQLAMLRPVTKAQLKVKSPGDIYPLVRQAFHLARAGAPGPVALEVPANYLILSQNVPALAYEAPAYEAPAPTPEQLDEAARLLAQARRPALYVGNGARGAAALVRALAERLGAPVTTTIHGKGIVSERHPLWLWPGFGATAPPFVRKVMEGCDCLLAIGCRFSEVATGSYGLEPPEALIHVDIEGQVLNRNYPARLAVESDAGVFLSGLLERLGPAREHATLAAEIARGHQALEDQRAGQRGGERGGERVSPAALFAGLQALAGGDAIYATDSGNGTFLAMEHLRLEQPGCFLAPVDYSSMGYAVPAAIGAKLANPGRDVVALPGDGALLMTGLELLTAAAYGVGVVVCVLRDGELAQIAQFERITLNTDTCAVLPPYSVEAFARTTNCAFEELKNDAEIGPVLTRALETARAGRPVVIDVAIDYGRKSFFTKGVVATNFWRLPWPERARLLARAVARRLRN